MPPGESVFIICVRAVEMDMCSNGSELAEVLGGQPFGALWARSLTITFLALALGTALRSQEPSHPAESIADAARNAREHRSNSTKRPKITTNDDLSVRNSVLSASVSPLEFSSASAAEIPRPQKAGSDSPAERLKTDLLVAQEEQNQIRRELSYQPTVISGANLDLKNFKPGYSGLHVGGPPLLETQPPISARLKGVDLEEKIASVKKALRIACDAPEDAETQTRLDSAEQELDVLQRQLVLDQDTYYSKPNYAGDTAGKVRLDAKLQQTQNLKSEIEWLKSKLAVSKANQVLK